MDTPLSLIHEDDDLIVVNKPAGLVVHEDGRTDEVTLAELLLAAYPTLAAVGGLHTLDSGRYVARNGIIHRLDRDTSGVILVAKHDDAFYFFQRQFLDRTIVKRYLALVHGVPEPTQGVIDLPIGRSRSDFRKWTTPPDARGTLRKAVSTYEVRAVHDAYAFLSLLPKTGRTHQLRVHLSAIGHPIVGDARYGGTPALGMDRLALHAAAIEIEDLSGKRQTFVAPLPDDLAQALQFFPKGTVIG